MRTFVIAPDISYPVLFIMVAIRHMWLFKCKFKLIQIQLKFWLFIHTSLVSRAQQTYVDGGYYIRQHYYRIFPLLQKVLLDSSAMSK